MGPTAQGLRGDVGALQDALTRTRREHERQVGAARRIAEEGQRVSAEVARLEARETDLNEAIGALQSLADRRQDELQRTVEELVTRGLQAVFGPDLSFHVNATTKGKLSAAELTIRSATADGTTVETPVLEARGGGVAAVTGFLLRLTVLLLKPNARRVLLLDESFSHVSDNYQVPLTEFVREVVDRTGTQIIMVTHSSVEEWIDVADVVYRASLKDGASEFTRAK